MFDEELLQSTFDWAMRFYQRKGLNAQDAQQGRTPSFAYAVQVARGILADFVQAQQRQPPAIPLKVPLPAGDADLVPLTQWGRPVGEGHNH